MYQKDKRKTILSFDDNNNIEDIQDVQQIVKIEKRHFKKGEFYMQSFELEKLITEENYSLVELRVLFALKNRLDYNNRIKTFRQSELAIDINSTQASVSRAIKKLEEDRIIEKDGFDYYFNDKFIKGSGDTRKGKK